MRDTEPDYAALERLARAALEYEPPWDLVTVQLAPAARQYVRALDPATVLALLARRAPGDRLDDIDRLRRQNKEAAERRDRETAAMQKRLAAFDRAVARARELVRGTPVDWTNDPPSKEPDGWWTYTSQQNREVLIAAVRALAADSRPEQPAPLDVERLARALHNTSGVITSGFGFTPDEHLAECREVAPRLAAEYARLTDSRPEEPPE